MIILVNSKISQSNIVESLGKPEYSYYFLLREFLPALEQIGTLIQISSLDEVDTLYDQY
ncbi:MAG TPA: glycosyltransferase, partial [Pseudomonas sp.]|nr:glycosyltransferase [Pseudomonas sp.]